MAPSTTTSRLRFGAVGHVTNDLLGDAVVPGGSAFYGALTAAYLGCAARIITSHGPDFAGLPALAAAGVTVDGGGGPRTTTFENSYQGGARHSRLLARAEPISTAAQGDVVLLGPVADELAATPAPTGRVVGAGLQGWLRRFDADGTQRRRALPEVAVLRGCHAAFLSREDTDAPDELVARLRAVVPLVILTRGAQGSDLFTADGVTHIAAAPAHEVDPTGAGDVFAAAFLIALARGQDPVVAGHFAARAAAVVVEDVGAGALPGLRGMMTD